MHRTIWLTGLALALVPGWILAAGALARGETRLIAWLGLGWVLGFVAALPGLAGALPALWLALTAAWLFRTRGQRAAADVV